MYTIPCCYSGADVGESYFHQVGLQRTPTSVILEPAKSHTHSNVTSTHDMHGTVGKRGRKRVESDE